MSRITGHLLVLLNSIPLKLFSFIFFVWQIPAISGHSQTLTTFPQQQKNRPEIKANELSDNFIRELGPSKKEFLNPSDTSEQEFLGADPQEKEQERLNLILEEWREAARYARDNTEDFAKLYIAISNYSKDLGLPSSQNNIALQSAIYGVLAMGDKEALNRYYKLKDIPESSEKHKEIAKEIKALKTIVNRIYSPMVTVFASGNIRGIATNTSPESTTAGTGTLGAFYSSSDNIFSAQLAVASTQDTIRSGFGTLLLAPGNGKSFQSAIIEWYPRIGKEFEWLHPTNSWLHLYGTFSASLWEIEKDANGNCTSCKSVSTVGFGLLYHHRLFSGLIADTEVGLSGEVGIAGRWLGGDIRNMLIDDIDTEKYLSIFPSKKSFYPGLEGGLTLNFGQVAGALQAYYLFKKKNEPIDGLTGLQISVGLSVRGDIIRGFLGNRE